MTNDELQPERKATGFAALGDLSFTKLLDGPALVGRPRVQQKHNLPQQAEPPSVRPPATPRPGPYQGKQAATGIKSFLPDKGTLFWGAAVLSIIALVYVSKSFPELVSQLAAPASMEAVPPTGTGQALSSEQIRYCLSESIRLNGARGALNTSSQFDIDRFNGMIVDYNSRCANFRYKPGSLDSVRAAVEANRSRLSFEGAARFPR